MKSTLITALTCLPFLTMTTKAELGEFGGVIEIGAGFFDNDAVPFYGGSIGFSYESTFGRHYLMLGGGFATQDPSTFDYGGLVSQIGTTSDVSLFNVGYRHGFLLSENFEPYLEVGMGKSSSSIGSFDAFGNPVQFEGDSSYFYGTVGISYRLYENLHLTGSLTYLGLGDDTPFGELRSDAFGNPTFRSQDVNFLARIGLSFRF